MSGSEEAQWVALYASLERRLYNVVYRLLWDKAESQDIVQEAFLRCWRRRSSIRLDGLNALLFRTALNLASNRRRSRRLWRFIGLADGGDEMPLAGHGDEEIPFAVQRAIAGLPDNLRRVLLLTELAGMSYAEVAMTLGIREGTVGSRRTRALEMLRRDLDIKGEVET
jgi:RNA polymerase sigma factor (sigma-70 family)